MTIALTPSLTVLPCPNGCGPLGVTDGRRLYVGTSYVVAPTNVWCVCCQRKYRWEPER